MHDMKTVAKKTHREHRITLEAKAFSRLFCSDFAVIQQNTYWGFIYTQAYGNTPWSDGEAT